jgi:4-amino-4-deoxy-L-arabinose transferase-like glycosyltransferase
LWQDEGETAVLGRCILLHGYPLATYGTNVVSDQPDHRDLRRGVWIWTPWLPLYVAAASFSVFGESTWAARAPFALVAWGAVLLSYLAFLDITGSRRLSRFASVLLMTSVPFLLHARQCRYYSLLVLFTLTHAWGYARILRAARWGHALVVVSGACLAQTFLPQLAASTTAFVAHSLLMARDRPALRRFLAATALVAAISLPFFVYSASWARDYGDSGHGFDSIGRLTAALRSYTLLLHAYLWPFLLAVPLAWRRVGTLPQQRARAARLALTVAALLALFALSGPPGFLTFATFWVVSLVLACSAMVWWVRNRSDSAMATDWRPLTGLLIAGTAISAAALCPYPFFRYVVGMLPFGALCTAYVAGELVSWHRMGIAVMAAFLVGTNLISQGPFVLAAQAQAPKGEDRRAWLERQMPYGHWQSNTPAVNVSRLGSLTQPWSLSPLSDYLDELTHDHDGPVEGVVRHLRANASPGQVLMATYENFPLMFYTDLTVLNLEQARGLSKPPDWIFVHKMTVSQLPPRIASNLARGYELVPIPVKEVNWENIPEPYWHYYRTRTDGEDITLFRLKTAALPP